MIKVKTTLHHHLIHAFDLTAYGGQNRWTAYNFVRKLHDHFAQIHWKRIQSAVAQLREPGLEPFLSITNSENDSELPDSQGTARAPASQDSAIFKKPELPPKKKRQNKGSEIAGLKAQVDILLKEQTSNASSRKESVL